MSGRMLEDMVLVCLCLWEAMEFRGSMAFYYCANEVKMVTVVLNVSNQSGSPR